MGAEGVGRSSATSSMTQTPAVAVGLGFVLGLATGLFLPRVVTQLRGRAGRTMPDRTPQNTIVYDENLPASLARREPAPGPNQPRYGGTGALGVTPRAVNPALGHVERTGPSQE
jgi:hypothetical protein